MMVRLLAVSTSAASPNQDFHGEEDKDWRNAMKCKIEQDIILGWKGSTADQWAASQAYVVGATTPVTVRVALWQTDNARE